MRVDHDSNLTTPTCSRDDSGRRLLSPCVLRGLRASVVNPRATPHRMGTWFAVCLAAASLAGCGATVSDAGADLAMAAAQACGRRSPKAVQAVRDAVDRKISLGELPAADESRLREVLDAADAARWEEASAAARRILADAGGGR